MAQFCMLEKYYNQTVMSYCDVTLHLVQSIEGYTTVGINHKNPHILQKCHSD